MKKLIIKKENLSPEQFENNRISLHIAVQNTIWNNAMSTSNVPIHRHFYGVGIGKLGYTGIGIDRQKIGIGAITYNVSIFSYAMYDQCSFIPYGNSSMERYTDIF